MIFNTGIVGLVHLITIPVDLVHRLVRVMSPFKSTTLCLEHRRWTRKKYFEKAFSSGRDVLLLSIMSQHTVKDMKMHLDEARRTKTTIRVLSWLPDSIATAAETLRKHLGENESTPERAVRQISEAQKDWESWKKEYGDVLQVAYYDSSPMMGGVLVKDRWVLVEVIPYHVHIDERPALLLGHFKDRKAFTLFQDKLNELWRDATSSRSR